MIPGQKHADSIEKPNARLGVETYAIPSADSLSASSAGSCPAPADVRSWPPIDTAVAAHVGAAECYAGQMRQRKIDQVLRTFADSL